MNAETPNFRWTTLYRIGGIAALLAGVIFRRNFAAEIALFGARQPPGTVQDWFALLQAHRLLGLLYLHLFDLVNVALLALMFLALYVALRQASRSLMAVALMLGLLGVAVYLSTNTAFSLLSLSDHYAAATTDAGRASLQAAGQALLAMNRFSSPGAHPGAGGYASLLLIALASLMTALVMLRSAPFSRVVAGVGILAAALDLAYCMAYAALPAVDGEQLSLLFIPAAGLFWTIWHILVGWRLTRLGNESSAVDGSAQESQP